MSQASSRTSSSVSLSSNESDLDAEESFYERLTALVDIVPPTTRHSITSTFSKTAGFLKSGGRVVGNIVWIVTTSALLVGLPLALSLEDESKIVAQEKEQYAQQYGAQQVRVICFPFQMHAKRVGTSAWSHSPFPVTSPPPDCFTDEFTLFNRWQHRHPCTLPRQAPIRTSRRESSLLGSDNPAHPSCYPIFAPVPRFVHRVLGPLCIYLCIIRYRPLLIAANAMLSSLLDHV